MTINGDELLFGIEDVPKIAFEFCGQCKIRLTEENNSGWWIFVRGDAGQMYQVPICKKCDLEYSASGVKK